MPKYGTKEKLVLVSTIISFITISIIATLFIVSKRSDNKESKQDIGLEVLNCLYTFDTSQMLNDNMQTLHSLCTNEVYNQLTIDNEERLLSTYLKFNSCECRVKVITKSNGMILYNLVCDAINPNRLFLFCYSINDKNKICSVREAECLDFISDDR